MQPSCYDALVSRFILVILALTACVAACGADKEANEARLFLDRYDSLEHPDFTARAERVETFARMRFDSESVKAAHETCSAMHEAAIEAEAKSVEARHTLEALEAAPPEQRTRERQQAVETLLGESSAAVERAAELRPRCDEQLAELRTRFETRH